jgi:rhodanese-related sulfurtransferase
MKHMRQVIYLNLLFLGFFVLPGCGDKPAEKKQGLVVINVLDKSLYDDCHIKGSICVPFENVTEYAQNNIDKSAEVILYCSNYHCSASGQACKQLKKLGFENVYAYEGGTAEWYQQGLPVEGPSTKRYLKQKITAHEQDLSEKQIITMNQLAHKMGFEK